MFENRGASGARCFDVSQFLTSNWAWPTEVLHYVVLSLQPWIKMSETTGNTCVEKKWSCSTLMSGARAIQKQDSFLKSRSDADLMAELQDSLRHVSEVKVRGDDIRRLGL